MAASGNTFTALSPGIPVQPLIAPSKRKKRFAKIREVIQGKR